MRPRLHWIPLAKRYGHRIGNFIMLFRRSKRRWNRSAGSALASMVSASFGTVNRDRFRSYLIIYCLFGAIAKLRNFKHFTLNYSRLMIGRRNGEDGRSSVSLVVLKA